ncbi:TonB-linked outer membrane protein, SusC/RagA family [Cyclobacterium lianum]|uniref:TonB-linked outer membrane protein, SusC/RagA family n=1 Tax=Cyclobacterium lianum TaxID=388280 RepID=A0A1M7N6T9_9BACT|nr:TonB-dependent receptor [Cyclobacterium lianum]SHM99325.1 TonB-linked outer membrane protein, SusC/RagA family [Cyclobacterium lianum]
MKTAFKISAVVLLLGIFPGHYNLFAQVTERLNISGTVTAAEDGSTIPGVTVLEKGTSNGTVTDIDGQFQIAVNSTSSVLIFSYVGYVTQEVPVGSQSNINVRLATDQQQLNEVVVVGYGTQRRKDLSGSISRITSEEFLQPSSVSFDQMLQGKVPGVQINQTTGAPGGNVNILVRGVSSITGGNQPLYVIDGYPVDGGGNSDMSNYGGSSFSSENMASNTSNRINPLTSINPSDIESIEILKDASATAIYGSRGSNGVVIITTKRGSYEKAQINLDISHGYQEVANKLDLMNARQYADFVADGRDNAWVYAGGNIDDPNEVRSVATRVRPEFRNPSSITTDTDWQDVIFRTAPVSNIQLSSRGGTENTNFFISAGYFSQEGIVINSDYNRFNLRVNFDAQITDKIRVGTSTYGSYGYGRFANTESHYGQGGLLSNALAASPTIPVYDDEGNYYFNQADVTDGLGFLANVLAVSEGTQDRRKVMDVFTNNYLEVDITENLMFRTSAGVNFSSNNTRLWRSNAVPLYTSLNYPATAGATKIENLNWLNENTFTYNRIIDNRHSLNAVVGFTAQKNSSDRLSAGASDFPTNYVTYLSGGIVNAGTQTLNEWSLLSLMARVNYSHDDKYLFTATVRRDGSSRFGSNYKWGSFPSFSVGYNISEEEFLSDADFLSNLKLRASYGISGNNQIGNYTHIGLLNTTRYINNSGLIPGLVPSSLANDDLTWEISRQTNFGLDLGLFQDRVNLTADVYRDLKTDLLLAVQLPAASGFTSSTQNIGDIENRGLELGLNTVNINQTNFGWNSNFTFTANRNKVLKLATEGGRIATSGFQVTQVGYPVSSFFLINKLGVFMTSEEVDGAALFHPRTQAGDLKFEDVDGNGVINQNDRKIVGDPWPDFVWGMDNNFRWGAFSFNVSLVGSQGAQTYLMSGGSLMGSNSVQNGLAIQDRRWRSEEDPGDGIIPRAIRSNHANGFGTSSNFLFDASFVRIRNVMLGYEMPQELVSRFKLTRLNVYANVANLYTWTDYPGYDPESTTTGSNVVNAGLDYLNYPLPRTYTLGLKITL